MRLLITTQKVDKRDPILGFFHRWIDEFSKHFDRIDVICLYEGEHTLPDHVHIHSLGKEAGVGKLGYVKRFYSYMRTLQKEHSYDFVFYHMGAIYNVLAAPYYLLRKNRRPQYYWWKTHGTINFMGRLALCFVDRVYTAARESFPVASKKRHVVGHAIDTSLFTYDTAKKNPSSLLFVGRVSRTKRIEQTIEVLQQLQRKYSAAALTIIGSVIDPGYKSELDTLIRENGLYDSVTFIEGIEQHELVNHYQKATVLMNPSDTDGLDKVALEGMACGTLPITANLSFEALLSPHDLYMKKGDVDGYARRIEELFELDRESYDAIASELSREVRTGHAIETLPKRLFNVG